jgi:hypothetical protein
MLHSYLCFYRCLLMELLVLLLTILEECSFRVLLIHLLVLRIATLWYEVLGVLYAHMLLGLEGCSNIDRLQACC